MARLDNGALLHSILLEQALEKGTQHTVITDTVTKLWHSLPLRTDSNTMIMNE